MGNICEASAATENARCLRKTDETPLKVASNASDVTEEKKKY
jgi:hypothetical protein